MYIYIYTLFFRIEKNHPGIVFARDYASSDEIWNNAKFTTSSVTNSYPSKRFRRTTSVVSLPASCSLL